MIREIEVKETPRDIIEETGKAICGMTCSC